VKPRRPFDVLRRIAAWFMTAPRVPPRLQVRPDAGRRRHDRRAVDVRDENVELRDRLMWDSNRRGADRYRDRVRSRLVYVWDPET